MADLKAIHVPLDNLFEHPLKHEPEPPPRVPHTWLINPRWGLRWLFHSLARARYTVRLCLIFAGWVKENQSTVAGIWATILEIFTAAGPRAPKRTAGQKQGHF